MSDAQKKENEKPADKAGDKPEDKKNAPPAKEEELVLPFKPSLTPFRTKRTSS